jgi:hypothetical protein
VARAISGNIFENQGSSLKFVDYKLIVEKAGAKMKRWLEYPVFKLFSNRECRGLGPWLVDQCRARSMVDRSPWPAVELIGARPSGCFRPWWLAAIWGKEGGRPKDSILPSSKPLMRASLPLYHLPLMTLLVMLMFSINPMIYVLDQLQEHVPSYWNNR